MSRETLSVVKQYAALLFGALLAAYFLYHTVYGEKGYLTEKHLQAEVRKAEDNLHDVQDDRQALERRVKGLKPESLDPDLLDEEARRQLGFTKPEEKVILTPQVQQKR